jgi:hypothetical protein
MPTVNITDHSDRVIARLPGYQEEATNWGKLLRALSSEVQAVEDALNQLENERYLSVAIGQQLDDIGTILNLAREGRSDAGYRSALQGQASALAGSGEGDLLLDGFLFLTAANSVTIIEYPFATAELAAHVDLDDFTAAEDTAILAAMRQIKAAGVQLVLLVVEDVAAEGLAFIWGDSADADASGDLTADADHGWGDSADANGNGDITPGLGQGGNFARVLT